MAPPLVLEGAGIGKTSVWRDGVEQARGHSYGVVTAVSAREGRCGRTCPM